jgi:hypothetical protein
MAAMAIVTSNSIKVKPRAFFMKRSVAVNRGAPFTLQTGGAVRWTSGTLMPGASRAVQWISHSFKCAFVEVFADGRDYL